MAYTDQLQKLLPEQISWSAEKFISSSYSF